MGKLIKKNSYDPQNLNLSQLVELKQGMEQDIKVDIKDKVKELLEIDAQPDVVDYIYTSSVKNNSSKETLLVEFQSLFNEKTNDFVVWMFTNLAPKYDKNAIGPKENILQDQTT